jgi:uncharacterized protein
MTSSSILVGVLSDTHGLLDPRVPGLFEDVDCLLHAGDIGSSSVFAGLQGLAPLTAVAGNVDSGSLLMQLRDRELIELGGVRILLIHILGDPCRLDSEMQSLIAETRPGVVVFGHSHQAFNERVGPTLFFNPGSAGPRRFNLPRSVGFLEISNQKVRGRIVCL